MIPNNNADGGSGSRARQDFSDAFIRNAHRILLGGYALLDAPAYHSSEEDEITGDLAREMMNHIAASPESWMRCCQVHDQHPVTAPGGPRTTRRVGKRRPKIDLQLVVNTGTGFTCFSWEAKRLGKGHGLAAYLGPAGLGCFLTGQYASDCDSGGMLGYAQTGDAASWVPEIRRLLDTECRISKSESGCYSEHGFASLHPRPLLQSTIMIHHTILRFN